MKRASRFASALLLAAVSAGAPAQDSAPPPPPTMQQAQAALQAGEFDKAAEMFAKIHEANPSATQAIFMHGYALHMAGKLDEALPYHLQAAAFPQFKPVALYNAACVHALKGRADRAFEYLRLSADTGQMGLEQVTGDSDLVSLHDDPRWQETLTRFKAAQETNPAQALRFWVGEWDCYAPNGTLAGSNRLDLINNGLFIHEQWTNAQNQSGQSFNYYDLERGLWRQVWADPSRTLDMTASPTTPGRLLFEGVSYTAAGERSLRQMLVQKLDGNRVLQEGRASDDEGQTWSVEYRLVYVKKGQPFSAEGLPEPGA